MSRCHGIVERHSQLARFFRKQHVMWLLKNRRLISEKFSVCCKWRFKVLCSLSNWIYSGRERVETRFKGTNVSRQCDKMSKLYIFQPWPSPKSTSNIHASLRVHSLKWRSLQSRSACIDVGLQLMIILLLLSNVCILLINYLLKLKK